MPTLSDVQKKQLIQIEPAKSVDYLLNCINKFDNLSLSDFPNMAAEKKAIIEDKLKSIPNPNEQNDWKEIEPMLSAPPSQETVDKLNAYIQRWESSRPADNHVDEAWKKISDITAQLKIEAERMEQHEWESVDITSRFSLMDYLLRYPNSVHKDKIDDMIWGAINKEDILDIQSYIDIPQLSRHNQEANDLMNAIVEWNDVKISNDIFLVNEYLITKPNTPFRQQALLLIARLKQQEIAAMKNAPNSYGVDRLTALLDKGITNERELILSQVMTENILETLRHTDIKNDLPDIRKAIEDSKAECKEGYTDVYFFGIPSTGKTCVLMGLSRANSLHVNLASGGGDYAAALQQYTDVGITVPRTPGSFVTTLEATINNRAYSDREHKINLVEMSGEEFAFDIANNIDHIFSFEKMGSGATTLLKNNNRKVFFLIIDPTANIVRITREIIDGYDEETGEPIIRLERAVVNQKTLIHKMVNLFEHESNADIMKKVDSIHIIMTKSDTLGDPVEREREARKKFKTNYEDDIIGPLIDLCKKYNCNSNSNTRFHPKLYTFSLGQFYVGGLYEYEQTDSNRLVKAIMNSTASNKKPTLWDKIKKLVN